jgi:hypothetical protein
MTGPTQDAPRRSLICLICTEPVPLETSNTDEKGRAVHEECYVLKTISNFRTAQCSSFPQNSLSATTSRFFVGLGVTENW